jgi:hypothetical protein
MISGVHISIFVMAVVHLYLLSQLIFLLVGLLVSGHLLYALIAGALSTFGAAISIQTLRLLIASRQEEQMANDSNVRHPHAAP